jgi:hypothetical protein
VAGYGLVLFDYLVARDSANGKCAVYPVTSIPETAVMPDRGPQVSQIRGYVNESGLLERIGRRAVQDTTAMSMLDAIQ